MKLKFGKFIALLVVMAFVAAACGGDDGDSNGSGDSGSTETIQVGYGSDLDTNDVADQIGIQAAGAEVTELTEDSAVIAGVIRGDLDVGNIDLTASVKATQSGVPLKIFYVCNKRFEYVLVSQPEIESFDQLAGKTVAYHSPGSGTEILPRVLVRQYDPALEDKIDWVVLPESPNRAAAMLSGAIDVTALEFPDVLTLQAEGDFNILAVWGDIPGPSANAISSVWFASEEYYNDHQEVLQDFATELQKGYDVFYEDKVAWMELAKSIVDYDDARLEKTYDFYNEQEMYPRSGEAPLTPELWSALDEFFREIGEYEDEANDDVVDYDIINAVSGA